MFVPSWSRGEWAGRRAEIWLEHQLLGCGDGDEGNRGLEQPAVEGRGQGRAGRREDRAHRLSGNLHKLQIQVG